MAYPHRSGSGRITRLVTRHLTYLARGCIRSYQLLISPMLGPCCRFYPSCSVYALEALQHYSFFTAIWYILKRMVRCGPWSRGGYDPVPISNAISEQPARVETDCEEKK